MQAANEVLKEAVRCHHAGDLGRAEYLYCQLIAHAEDHPELLFGLGTLYAQANAPGRAITFLKRAIDLMPRANGAMENLAAVYRTLENRDKARYWGERALKLERTAIALSNMSGTYINDRNPELALKWAEEAIALDPLPQALNHKALALLELGRFEEGWATYDARLNLPNFHKRLFECPMWDGSSVKKLAIHGEQGLGDEILFLACLAQLKDRAEEIEIEAAPRLVRLIQHSFPDVQVYGEHADRAFEPDAYIAMGSLPGLCWPVQPNAYLKPTTVIERNGEEPRIGISWKGGTVQSHAPLRNTAVEHWKTLLDLGEVFSLQYGDQAEEAASLGIWHDADAIADLDHLAALIKSCDLVITVCNTTVHMAGALGVPCLCLVPYRPAWRYGLTGDRMVWYDSVTLIRQGEKESWISVLARAKKHAKELCADLRKLSRAEPVTA